MARKAKFPIPAEAEKWALDRGAPRRGSGIPITSATRGLIRFWLTANGIPSSRAVLFNLGQMTAAWHDLTGIALATLKDEAPPPTPAPTPARDEHPWDVFEQDWTPEDEAPARTPVVKINPVPARFKPEDFPIPARNEEDTDMTKTDHEKALDALKRILQPDAAPLDENAVVEIVNRRLGDTVKTVVGDAADKARQELADLLEEARAIVNGAPRVLRIEVAGRIKELPAAPRHCMFDTLLAMVVASREPGGQMPMIVGPAGGGKTTACEHVATALGLPFYSDGALFSEHKLTGYKDGAGQYHTTSFRQAFEHGGVYCMDEADRSDPSVPVVLNSALANGFMAFPDRAEPVRRHRDFVPLIAANTFGRGADRLYVGANQLDGATTDRTVALNWDYDEVLERALAGDDAWVSYVQAARASAWKHKVRHIISPRASMGGAALRRAGLPFDLVAEASIWKGLDAEQRNRIIADIPDNVTRRAQVARITLAAE
jgi:cobaltochelatase CobS